MQTNKLSPKGKVAVGLIVVIAILLISVATTVKAQENDQNPKKLPILERQNIAEALIAMSERISSLKDTVVKLEQENQQLKKALQREDWRNIEFLNGWTNYDGDYNSAAYYKDPFGVVHLRGLVKSGSGTIFILPKSYRPVSRELFGTCTGNNNAIGRIDILRNGEVKMIAGSNAWISLDGIIFHADH